MQELKSTKYNNVETKNKKYPKLYGPKVYLSFYFYFYEIVIDVCFTHVSYVCEKFVPYFPWNKKDTAETLYLKRKIDGQWIRKCEHHFVLKWFSSDNLWICLFVLLCIWHQTASLTACEFWMLALVKTSTSILVTSFLWYWSTLYSDSY